MWESEVDILGEVFLKAKLSQLHHASYEEHVAVTAALSQPEPLTTCTQPLEQRSALCQLAVALVQWCTHLRALNAEGLETPRDRTPGTSYTAGCMAAYGMLGGRATLPPPALILRLWEEVGRTAAGRHALVGAGAAHALLLAAAAELGHAACAAQAAHAHSDRGGRRCSSSSTDGGSSISSDRDGNGSSGRSGTDDSSSSYADSSSGSDGEGGGRGERSSSTRHLVARAYAPAATAAADGADGADTTEAMDAPERPFKRHCPHHHQQPSPHPIPQTVRSPRGQTPQPCATITHMPRNTALAASHSSAHEADGAGTRFAGRLPRSCTAARARSRLPLSRAARLLLTVLLSDSPPFLRAGQLVNCAWLPHPHRPNERGGLPGWWEDGLGGVGCSCSGGGGGGSWGVCAALARACAEVHAAARRGTGTGTHVNSGCIVRGCEGQGCGATGDAPDCRRARRGSTSRALGLGLSVEDATALTLRLGLELAPRLRALSEETDHDVPPPGPDDVCGVGDVSGDVGALDACAQDACTHAPASAPLVGAVCAGNEGAAGNAGVRSSEGGRNPGSSRNSSRSCVASSMEVVAQLLWPVPLDEFVLRAWEAAPLYCSARGNAWVAAAAVPAAAAPPQPAAPAAATQAVASAAAIQAVAQAVVPAVAANRPHEAMCCLHHPATSHPPHITPSHTHPLYIAPEAVAPPCDWHWQPLVSVEAPGRSQPHGQGAHQAAVHSSAGQAAQPAAQLGVRGRKENTEQTTVQSAVQPEVQSAVQTEVQPGVQGSSQGNGTTTTTIVTTTATTRTSTVPNDLNTVRHSHGSAPNPRASLLAPLAARSWLGRLLEAARHVPQIDAGATDAADVVRGWWASGVWAPAPAVAQAVQAAPAAVQVVQAAAVPSVKQAVQTASAVQAVPHAREPGGGGAGGGRGGGRGGGAGGGGMVMRHGQDVRLVRCTSAAATQPPPPAPPPPPLLSPHQPASHQPAPHQPAPPQAPPHRPPPPPPPPVMEHALPADGPVPPTSILTALRAGYTLALRALGARDACAAAVESSLSLTLGGSPGCNLYVTPPGAQGLPPHFDDHCVWVAHLRGRKAWRLRAPEGWRQPRAGLGQGQLPAGLGQSAGQGGGLGVSVLSAGSHFVGSEGRDEGEPSRTAARDDLGGTSSTCSTCGTVWGGTCGTCGTGGVDVLPLAYSLPALGVRAFKEGGARPPDELELELGPGDLLYIPRGWAHQAVACSAHEDVKGQEDEETGLDHTEVDEETGLDQLLPPGTSMHCTFGLEVEAGMAWQALVHHAVASAATAATAATASTADTATAATAVPHSAPSHGPAGATAATAVATPAVAAAVAHSGVGAPNLSPPQSSMGYSGICEMSDDGSTQLHTAPPPSVSCCAALLHAWAAEVAAGASGRVLRRACGLLAAPPLRRAMGDVAARELEDLFAAQELGHRGGWVGVAAQRSRQPVSTLPGCQREIRDAWGMGQREGEGAGGEGDELGLVYQLVCTCVPHGVVDACWELTAHGRRSAGEAKKQVAPQIQGETPQIHGQAPHIHEQAPQIKGAILAARHTLAQHVRCGAALLRVACSSSCGQRTSQEATRSTSTQAVATAGASSASAAAAKALAVWLEAVWWLDTRVDHGQSMARASAGVGSPGDGSPGDGSPGGGGGAAAGGGGGGGAGAATHPTRDLHTHAAAGALDEGQQQVDALCPSCTAAAQLEACVRGGQGDEAGGMLGLACTLMDLLQQLGIIESAAQARKPGRSCAPSLTWTERRTAKHKDTQVALRDTAGASPAAQAPQAAGMSCGAAGDGGSGIAGAVGGDGGVSGDCGMSGDGVPAGCGVAVGDGGPAEECGAARAAAVLSRAVANMRESVRLHLTTRASLSYTLRRLHERG